MHLECLLILLINNTVSIKFKIIFFYTLQTFWIVPTRVCNDDWHIDYLYTGTVSNQLDLMVLCFNTCDSIFVMSIILILTARWLDCKKVTKLVSYNGCCIMAFTRVYYCSARAYFTTKIEMVFFNDCSFTILYCIPQISSHMNV